MDSTDVHWLSKGCLVATRGQAIKFGDCVRILHQLPKFNPSLEEEEEEADEEAKAGEVEDDSKPKARTFNKVGNVMGDNLERPEGNKKAKKNRLLEELSPV